MTQRLLASSVTVAKGFLYQCVGEFSMHTIRAQIAAGLSLSSARADRCQQEKSCCPSAVQFSAVPSSRKPEHCLVHLQVVIM